MSRLVSVRIEDLAEPALAWAIESIEGAAPAHTGQMQLALGALPLDDAQCERLIAKYAVWVEPDHRVNWVADTNGDPFERASGETRVIAVCRAVLMKTMGKTYSVPADLI